MPAGSVGNLAKVRRRSGRFERLGDSDLRQIVDTSRLRAGDDIRGIGVVKQPGTLTTYHVTDDPIPVITLLGRKGRLMAAYGEKGQRAELGPGLYASDNPSFWANRSLGKWDFLKRITATELKRLGMRLSDDLAKRLAHGGISRHEYDLGARDLGYVLSGQYDTESLVQLASLPYGIRFWDPEYLASVGIRPGRDPRVLEIRVKGQLAELSRTRPSATLLRALRRGGVSGAFTRSGMGTNPEMVIWDPRAIVGVQEVPFR
jgi:hypothetical protein